MQAVKGLRDNLIYHWEPFIRMCGDHVSKDCCYHFTCSEEFQDPVYGSFFDKQSPQLKHEVRK